MASPKQALLCHIYLFIGRSTIFSMMKILHAITPCFLPAVPGFAQSGLLFSSIAGSDTRAQSAVQFE